MELLDADDLELRALLVDTLLSNLNPLFHQYVTPELIEALMDAIYTYYDKLLALDEPT